MQCAGHRWIWCRWLKHHLWFERKHRPTKARTSEIKQWIIISYPREFTQPIHAHQYAYSKRLKRTSPANEIICSISSLKRWLCNVCILSGPNPTSKNSGPDWWILAKDNNTIQHQFTMSCKGDKDENQILIKICSNSKTLKTFSFFAKGQRQGIMRTKPKTCLGKNLQWSASNPYPLPQHNQRPTSLLFVDLHQSKPQEDDL